MKFEVMIDLLFIIWHLTDYSRDRYMGQLLVVRERTGDNWVATHSFLLESPADWSDVPLLAIRDKTFSYIQIIKSYKPQVFVCLLLTGLEVYHIYNFMKRMLKLIETQNRTVTLHTARPAQTGPACISPVYSVDNFETQKINKILRTSGCAWVSLVYTSLSDFSLWLLSILTPPYILDS